MAKILALVTDAFGGGYGIAQYNRDFLAALSSANAQVIVHTRQAPLTEKPPHGIEQRPPKQGRFSYSCSALLEAFRMKPDIVFCGHLYMAPLGWLAAKIANAKFVIQTHGIEAWSRPSRLRCWSCEKASMIFSVSRHTRGRVLDWASIQPERAVVVPNTVDDCFTPGDESTLIREWQLENKKILLTVGRMSTSERYKGHDRVIETLSALGKAGHDLVYVIAGGGDDRSRLERLAKDLGVKDRVRFVGILTRDQLIETYRIADLFVMPSTGEGFGIAFLEAMACGTLALGINAAGSRDALADGELGILADGNDLTRAISDALSQQKRDPAELHRAVQLRFGRDLFQARIAAILSELIKAA